MMLSGAGDTAAADSATVVKLLRVMLLMPVVVLVAVVLRPAPGSDGAADGPDVPLVPGFLLAFVVFMLLATSALVPPAVSAAAGALSRGLLVVAIAAAGIKTRLQELLRLGWVPVVMLVAETVWIAGVAAAGITLLGR
jgi:uncharacterized membrane protein YadS